LGRVGSLGTYQVAHLGLQYVGLFGPVGVRVDYGGSWIYDGSLQDLLVHLRLWLLILLCGSSFAIVMLISGWDGLFVDVVSYVK
jgi:hypothetical protein